MPRSRLLSAALGLALFVSPAVAATDDAACAALAKELAAAEQAARAGRPPSFLNDVEPLLTRQGCNQGACHGKGSGQNGFRLSLRGYAPESDHRWLTRELGARRVAADPEQSLLLLKPTGQSPHEGGKVFGTDSREYRLLADWVAAGMPGPSKDDPKLTRLELLPATRTLAVNGSVPMLCVAEFSDGSKRDVTWLTRFDSNDPGLVSVTPAGLATARRPGETAVRASYLDQVAVAILTTPYETPVAPEKLTARNNFIDDAVFAKLGRLRIEPSDLCADAEFVRRAFLDATGTLPTPEEVRQFLADNRPDKRARLIDALLDRPEFTDFWTLQLADLLQNRKERDHDVRGTKGVRAFHDWLHGQVARNRPWYELARDVLTAKGSSAENPAVGYFVVTVGESGDAERSEVVASVAQAFLGTRIGCAQCHNHPLEKYTQDDYYHFSAFFSRVRMDRKEPRAGVTSLIVGTRDANRLRSPVGVSQPRTGQFLKPQPLDRSPTDVQPGDDPREKLAVWMTDPKNEYFSGAMVNRIWRHYLGVGLVEPVDDLRATNPPTNPELWKALNAEFVGHKYDLKHLMRVILNSRTYQLSSATRPANATDTRFYSHYYARRLPAEVLMDAMSAATGVPDRFPGYPVGTRAVQLPDPALGSYFLTLFGRSDRVTACACERNGEVTLPQLLHLLNGSVVEKVRSGDGRLAKLLADKNDDAVLDEVFLASLGRLPKPEERSAFKKALADDPNREEAYRDLFWAVLNSKDFAFNH